MPSTGTWGPWGLRRRGVAAAIAIVGLNVAVAACSDDDDTSTSAAAGSTTTTAPAAATDDCTVDGGSDAEPTTSVQVSLTEYGIAAEPQTAPAGPVELVAVNQGRIPHELMVVRFDGDPGALPVDMFGGADEAQLPEDALAGKIRLFWPGETCRATFDLAAGSYALICNLVDDGSNPHYVQGMHTRFTVT